MFRIVESTAAEFNDKYFPRVDLSNKTRYQYYRYKGKDFAYDFKYSTLILLYKDDEEIEEVGEKNTPWRSLGEVGLNINNWKNKKVRDEYLDEYCAELDLDAQEHMQDFINNELPFLKSRGLVDEENIVDIEDHDGEILFEYDDSTDDIIDSEYYDDGYDTRTGEPWGEYDDDALSNIYGGDRSYCPDCGSSRYHDGHCYECDPIVEEDINLSPEKKYNVVVYLPFYDNDGDDEMAYMTIPTTATSEDEARENVKKTIGHKKRSKNGRAWKDAEIHSVSLRS